MRVSKDKAHHVKELIAGSYGESNDSGSRAYLERMRAAKNRGNSLKRNYKEKLVRYDMTSQEKKARTKTLEHQIQSLRAEEDEYERIKESERKEKLEELTKRTSSLRRNGPKLSYREIMARQRSAKRNSLQKAKEGN